MISMSGLSFSEKKKWKVNAGVKKRGSYTGVDRGGLKERKE